eukprot:TRINITY_DN12862_c0_g1_i1.p1 TRINITY_DN12862_c0_g1~~TRINITY_DN12862_c0_g1_i1.p1  ORF type:complete len:323 (+),score=34.82 TRINITY_DN12862_c0_g1_i1:70-1038(+)
MNLKLQFLYFIAEPYTQSELPSHSSPPARSPQPFSHIRRPFLPTRCHPFCSALFRPLCPIRVSSESPQKKGHKASVFPTVTHLYYTPRATPPAALRVHLPVMQPPHGSMGSDASLSAPSARKRKTSPALLELEGEPALGSRSANLVSKMMQPAAGEGGSGLKQALSSFLERAATAAPPSSLEEGQQPGPAVEISLAVDDLVEATDIPEIAANPPDTKDGVLLPTGNTQNFMSETQFNQSKALTKMVMSLLKADSDDGESSSSDSDTSSSGGDAEGNGDESAPRIPTAAEAAAAVAAAASASASGAPAGARENPGPVPHPPPP